MIVLASTKRKTTTTATTINVCECKKVDRRQYRFLCRFVLIFLIFAAATIYKARILLNSSLQSENNVIDSNVLTGNYRLNVHNQSIYRFYIDVGCYNGDSIDQFIYFTHDSHLYDIFTFEPDRENLHLCRKRLEEEKYRKYNIIIIPYAAWIRDEKVLYRVNKGFVSRIETETNSTIFSTKLQAIDFSAWLSRIINGKKTYLHLRLSMPDAEVSLLEKLILDGLLGITDRLDLEWTDRKKLAFRGRRIYLQSALDGLGFAMMYMTRPSEIQKVVENKGNWKQVPKYGDWQILPESDTMTNYMQRPVRFDPPRTTRKWPISPTV